MQTNGSIFKHYYHKYKVTIKDRYGFSVEKEYYVQPYGETKIEISNNKNSLRAIISGEYSPYKVNWISRDGIEARNVEQFNATESGIYATVIADKNNCINSIQLNSRV